MKTTKSYFNSQPEKNAHFLQNSFNFIQIYFLLLRSRFFFTLSLQSSRLMKNGLQLNLITPTIICHSYKTVAFVSSCCIYQEQFVIKSFTTKKLCNFKDEKLSSLIFIVLYRILLDVSDLIQRAESKNKKFLKQFFLISCQLNHPFNYLNISQIKQI